MIFGDRAIFWGKALIPAPRLFQIDAISKLLRISNVPDNQKIALAISFLKQSLSSLESLGSPGDSKKRLGSRKSKKNVLS